MASRLVMKVRENLFWDRVREGMSAAAACESIGVGRKQGYRWIKAAGGRIPVPTVASSGRFLGQEERLRIADLRLGGAGVRAIARDLGRAASTVRSLSDQWMHWRWCRCSTAVLAAAVRPVARLGGPLRCRLLEHCFGNGGTEPVSLVNGYHGAAGVAVKPRLGFFL